MSTLKVLGSKNLTTGESKLEKKYRKLTRDYAAMEKALDLYKGEAPEMRKGLEALAKDVWIAKKEWLDALENKPEPGKLYSLTGGPGTPSIAAGNSWAESEVESV